MALFAAWVGFACTLTAQGQQATAIHAALPVNLSDKTPTQETPPMRRLCQVKTGFAEGRLNLRACSGLACSVLAVMDEGEILTPIQPQPIDGWLEVQTDSLHGWVNSNYCPMKEINEVKK